MIQLCNGTFSVNTLEQIHYLIMLTNKFTYVSTKNEDNKVEYYLDKVYFGYLL